MERAAMQEVAELVAATQLLLSSTPINRAELAKRLIDQAKSTYSRVRQDAIAEALDEGRTYEELAAELGVSAAAINAAVTARNARRAFADPPRRHSPSRIIPR